MSSADRMRRLRERSRCGQIYVPLVIDEARVSSTLVSRGYLHPSVADDRTAIAKAAQRLLEEEQADTA